MYLTRQDNIDQYDMQRSLWQFHSVTSAPRLPLVPPYWLACMDWDYKVIGVCMRIKTSTGNNRRFRFEIRCINVNKVWKVTCYVFFIFSGKAVFEDFLCNGQEESCTTKTTRDANIFRNQCIQERMKLNPLLVHQWETKKKFFPFAKGRHILGTCCGDKPLRVCLMGLPRTKAPLGIFGGWRAKAKGKAELFSHDHLRQPSKIPRSAWVRGSSWDPCCGASTQGAAQEADWGITITEITESAWELVSMARFYWFMSILWRGQFARAVHTMRHWKLGSFCPHFMTHEFKPAKSVMRRVAEQNFAEPFSQKRVRHTKKTVAATCPLVCASLKRAGINQLLVLNLVADWLHDWLKKKTLHEKTEMELWFLQKTKKLKKNPRHRFLQQWL